MADDPLYEMPPFTGRNILIFSDGTGQAGGLLPDEVRSNVYKLFRATRCGPDTNIDPDRQLTFYDPGLGSKSAGGEIKIGWMRWIYNALSSATGLGITKNIIDCYVALIYLWRPGDRIFLFGFSRGDTVRCLGGVLGLCGIPTRKLDGSGLIRNPAAMRKIAKEAVKRVYRHGIGASDATEKQNPRAYQRTQKLRQQRDALGRQFRTKYDCDIPEGANAIPHFLGVWDTVAAVGLSAPAWKTTVGVALAALVAIAAGGAWRVHPTLDTQFGGWFVGTLAVIALFGYAAYIALRIKFVTGLPGYKWYQTLHLTSFKMQFFDKALNARVRYARHALSIDERRADFPRVPWVNDKEPANRELAEGAWFRQIWFAGNHSDIGGSYPENESRLSDIALGWMAHDAKRAGIHINDELLAVFGRANGQQHDECRVGISFLGMRFRWREKTRDIVKNAIVHPSVRERFALPAVLNYDAEIPYRPEALRDHQDFAHYYDR